LIAAPRAAPLLVKAILPDRGARGRASSLNDCPGGAPRRLSAARA